jgi:hypothetical protein
VASYRGKTVYRRRFRQPSFWNNLKFELSLLPLFNPMSEFPMSTSRRNVIIRTITTLSGDIAIGVALASACIWIIETAALGLFLSFLVWLLGALAALALSQYVLHPALTATLSDRKLDLVVSTVTGLADRLTRFTRAKLQPA